MLDNLDSLGSSQILRLSVVPVPLAINASFPFLFFALLDKNSRMQNLFLPCKFEKDLYKKNRWSEQSCMIWVSRKPKNSSPTESQDFSFLYLSSG